MYSKKLCLVLLLPPYFLPKDWKVPFSKATWYDAIHLFLIYDWASTWLKSVPTQGKDRATLRSAGCSLTLTLPEHRLSGRVDVFWPLARMPADGDRCHVWVTITKDFTF